MRAHIKPGLPGMKILFGPVRVFGAWQKGRPCFFRKMRFLLIMATPRSIIPE